MRHLKRFSVPFVNMTLLYGRLCILSLILHVSIEEKEEEDTGATKICNENVKSNKT